MTSFKLYRCINENEVKQIGYFETEIDLINFFNNAYELKHYSGISAINEFKTLLEVKVFISHHGAILKIEELE